MQDVHHPFNFVGNADITKLIMDVPRIPTTLSDP